MEAIPKKQRRRHGQNTLLIVLVLVILCGGIGLAWSRSRSREGGTGNLLTDTVTRGNLRETVSATGSVTAQTGAEVKIGSQITGRIKHLYADVGSVVKANQVIAELDLPDVEAQLAQAQEGLRNARTKFAQQRSGVPMEKAQTHNAVQEAQEQLNSAQAKLASAQAAVKQQVTQTPADIKRAETALAASEAALSTANSNLNQVQAGANLQVATAEDQMKQAQANNQYAALNLKRQTALLARGFVAASEVDTAQTQETIDESQVETSQKNVSLVQQKVSADLQAAKDQVTQAEQNEDAAQAALVATRAEVNQDAVKRADVNDALAQVRVAEAALKTAQANEAQDTLKLQDVEQAGQAIITAQDQIAYNQAQVDKTFIRSPISGTVLQLAAQQGETLAAGLSAPTLIIVADLNRLQVDAYVDETDIGAVRLGQEAEVSVDAFPKKRFKGRVTKIASGSTIQQGVVTYDVTVALDNPQQQLKPDMTASVTIQTGRRDDVLLVPSEAVKSNGRGVTVSVLVKPDGKSVVQQRTVKTGGTDGVNTEIRDGLKEGETVVLAGMAQQGPARPAGRSPFAPSGGGGRGR